MKAESVISKLPALKFFSLRVPHCVKLGLWSGLAGFRDNTYSTDEGIECADAETSVYDTYMQSKMFKAAEMAGVNVKKSLVFLRRPPSFFVDPRHS